MFLIATKVEGLGVEGRCRLEGDSAGKEGYTFSNKDKILKEIFTLKSSIATNHYHVPIDILTYYTKEDTASLL